MQVRLLEITRSLTLDTHVNKILDIGLESILPSYVVAPPMQVRPPAITRSLTLDTHVNELLDISL